MMEKTQSELERCYAKVAEAEREVAVREKAVADILAKQSSQNSRRERTMKSDLINEISAALAKAQGEMGGAHKSAANPFFKSKYADLESVWDACREPLAKNGLAVIQTVEQTAQGDSVLITTLSHSSGQWFQSVFPLRPVKNDPQGMGSAITYARRFSLSAIVGVYQTDDDGNQASGKNAPGIFPAQPAEGDGMVSKKYVVPGGNYGGLTIEELHGPETANYLTAQENAFASGKRPKPYWWDEFARRCEDHFGTIENQK